MARKFSRLEKALAALVGLDIARPGTNRAAAKAAVGALARGGRVLVPAAARTTTSLAAANPDLTGALLGGAALQTPQGQQLLDIAEERGRTDRLAVEREVQDLLFGTAEKVKRGTKKRKTKFNKAVSSGLKALKASTSYGKKGTINNAKRAFSAVTKVASKVNKGKKVSAKGVTGTIARAVRKIL